MTIRLLCCSGSLDGGGSERQLWQLTARIDRTRYAAQVYLLDRRGKYLEQLPADVPVDDFSSQVEPSKWRLPGQAHRDHVKHLRSVIARDAIDVVYDRTYHMTLVTGPACRLGKTPRVSVIVSPPSQAFANSHERFAWLKKRLLARAYRDPLAMAVAVSQSVADDAVEFFGLPADCIRVMRSPIDIDGVEKAAAEQSHQVQENDNIKGMRVCVVGRLSREKGQLIALKAFAQASSKAVEQRWSLDIVGDGPDRDMLESATLRLGIQDNVRFHGFVDNPYPIIKSSDLLVIPSKFEGFPNVALEAMALETAVLSTDCSGSLTELLGGCGGSGGLRGQVVSVDDIPQLAHAMSQRFQEHDLWLERIAKAREIVVREHDLHSWIEQMEQLLAEMVSLHRSRGA